MNSLEFIENTIKNIKQMIKEQNKYIEDNQNCPDLLEFHIEQKEYLEIDLNHFKQIKAELEAWYVVKEKAEIIEVVTTFASPIYAKETTPTLGNSEPVEIRISIVGQDKIKTFKKALEVEE